MTGVARGFSPRGGEDLGAGSALSRPQERGREPESRLNPCGERDDKTHRKPFLPARASYNLDSRGHIRE